MMPVMMVRQRLLELDMLNTWDRVEESAKSGEDVDSERIDDD